MVFILYVFLLAYSWQVEEVPSTFLEQYSARLAPFDIKELRDLMSEDEITVMDGSKCIFQLRGVRPFFSEKFDIIKHKNYKLLEDFSKKNAFD